ncbi:MAG: 5'-nucleotidase, partial [bacterium]
GGLITGPSRWGLRLGRGDVALEGETGKGFRVVSKRSRTLSTDGVAPDPEVMAMMEPYRKVMDEYLGQVIGQAAGDFLATEGRRKETALSDLTLKVLCEVTGTDVAFHDVWALDKHLKAGPITIGDVFRVYFYEDAIYLVELTGRQFKEALEYSASLWGQRKDYTFGAAAGVTYTMDVSRPAGDRIVGLASRGKPVEPDQKLRVAINSYHAQGGGGYKMFKDAPLLNNTRLWVREAVIDSITRQKTITPATDGNWTVVGSSSPR